MLTQKPNKDHFNIILSECIFLYSGDPTIQFELNVEIDLELSSTDYGYYQIEKTIKLYLIYWAHAFASESERIC